MISSGTAARAARIGADETFGPLRKALAALEALLERRVAQAIDEVAHYPTPIARCDEQLTKLLEERSSLVVRLDATRALIAEVRNEAAGFTQVREAVKAFLDAHAAPDDLQETIQVAAVAAAIQR